MGWWLLLIGQANPVAESECISDLYGDSPTIGHARRTERYHLVFDCHHAVQSLVLSGLILRTAEVCRGAFGRTVAEDRVGLANLDEPR